MNLVAERHDASAFGRLASLWPLLYVIFLPNIAPPLSTLFHAHPSAPRLTLVLGGAALFVIFYLWAAWHNDMSRAVYPAPGLTKSWRQWGPVAVLAVLSVALILGDGSPWLCLLIFTSAVTGGRLPLGPAIGMIVGLTCLTALLGRVTGDTLTDLGQAAFWTAMSGALTTIMNYLRSTNRAVRTAREEITRLAVEAERLRFARDLHDLLGHDLARIALQSELAEALAPTAPDQAISVMHDVGNVARKALREVRATVAGYRRPTLIGESRAAGEILAAAGIAYQFEGERIEVALEVEAVLAWAVREGVTNVVKHSRARHCTVRLMRAGSEVAVEVIDNGPGSGGDTRSNDGGSGLAGLAERAAALGGRCEARPCPGTGFRLRVSVPAEPIAPTDAAVDQLTAHGTVGTGARA